jgi:hypothetical protein
VVTGSAIEPVGQMSEVDSLGNEIMPIHAESLKDLPILGILQLMRRHGFVELLAKWNFHFEQRS